MPKRKMNESSIMGKIRWAAVAGPSCWLLLVALTFPSSSCAWMPAISTRRGLSRRIISRTSPVIVTTTTALMVQDDESSHEQSPHAEEAFASPRNVTQEVLKKVRVAKAQAEIDRILQGPDPPIDTEAELEKVVSMSHLPSEQPLLDAEMAQLESELYEAVKQQDFSLASTKKDELGQLQKEAGGGVVDDGGAVLQVNAAFYRAFSKKSFEDMERVWLRHDGDTSICIHPSHKPLVGARRISNSWKQMFASTDGSFQRNWMEPHKIRIMLKGSQMAIVTCEEHVYARRFVRGAKRQTELINKLLATNIFRKVNQQWYMCYHHASWHPESDAAKRALSGGDGSSSSRVVSESDFQPTSSLAATLRARRRKRRRQLEDEEDEDEDMIGMDGILGNDFGPILGDGKGDGEGENPPKRIIMGASLSDLLKGGLGDILGGEGDEKGSDPNNNHGLPQEGAIIQFSRIDDEDDDEEDLDMHDFDEVDEDDEDEENDVDHEGESVAIIKEWAKSSSQASKHNGEEVGGDARSKFENPGSGIDAERKSGKVFKDALRQNCISALRKLSDQGSIAPKQKRVLLTDIITCSSKGEFSMVEVAYELLCGEGESDEEDAAEEEFAEQCRVFAQELLQKQDSQIL